ncbi:MAG: hypothetical protein ABW321_29620, partial [Polyangiales bacterium]
RASQEPTQRTAAGSDAAAQDTAAPASPSVLFEQSVALTEQADTVADRLRREASRVAEAARLMADQAALAATLDKVAAEQRALSERAAIDQAAWELHFQRAGVAVRTVRETSSLLSTQKGIEAQCDQLERDLAATTRELAHEKAAEREWLAGWQLLTSDLALSPDVGTAELEAVLEARSELVQRYDSAELLAGELASLERELAAFASDVAALCHAHAPELAEQPAELAAERLIKDHAQTHAADGLLTQRTAALAGRRDAGDRAQLELAQADRNLSALMEAAGVTDLVALEVAEQRSARALELDAAQHQHDSELAAAADGEDPEQVEREAGRTLDEVRVRLDELAEQLDALDHARQTATHQVANVRAGLAKLHNNHAAGDAAADALVHLAEVRTLSERYVRVRLAASVLKREIERYRERHRAPVLREAATLFQQLTLGAYDGLDVDYGDHDEPILVCVRHDATRVTVPALSTGTRDQLYLALRLASIRHLASEKEPLPLILDDVLVHFDEDRAGAALVALADFAATTQVLFFTHHHKLCELAEQTLPEDRVQIHRMPLIRPRPTLAVLPV